MNQREIIKQFSEDIDKVVNQDAVRAETGRRELDSGLTDEFVANSVNMASKMYVEALNKGFSDDQAFTMALNYSGILS